MKNHKKYLISIQKKGESRYDAFFEKNNFQESDFNIYGIKGIELSTRDYFELAVGNHITPLTPAELGCTLSHLQALKDFINSDAEYAYVFEDDVTFKKDIDFDTDLSFLNEGFILSLGGINLFLCRKARGSLLSQTYADQPILKLHPYFSDKAFYAMGYIMDKRAAQAYIKYHQTIQLADDWQGFLAENPGIHFYFTDLLNHPELNFINNTQSSIENERLSILKPSSLPSSFFALLTIYFKQKKKLYKKRIKRFFTQNYPRS
ncbi:glycosyltransferase family 25 protein [Acinetobacter sp. WZC-1]|uniref:glycosyltransferase family 25 protein n=1 Tax=Acinetobacter sp. WZC-1 TaxID=3459034 RepID=UPI00403D6218